MPTDEYYVGIDVGTGSVRAALVTRDGAVVASSIFQTKTWRDPTDHRIFEQSTEDIWRAVCCAVRICIDNLSEDISLNPEIIRDQIKGLGFDATCSLAVVDHSGTPICVTRGEGLGSPGPRNIILWADHRAEVEAERINRTGSMVLDYVGGKMSLEMEIPKVLWLKTHMSPNLFPSCEFFDLPDWLTYKATGGNRARSCCSLACKCGYVPSSDDGWQADFFEKIGLGDLVERGYAQVGAGGKIGEDGKGEVLMAGMPVGKGLSKEAAEELGLVEGTPVGSALIDAYSGWVGTVAAQYTVESENKSAPTETGDNPPVLEESGHRLALVAGTSTCHLIQSPKGVFVNGVWGPYKNAIFNEWWMNEGGQSSTGQLIDFILTTHPAYPELEKIAEEKGKNIYVVLEDMLEDMRRQAGVESLTELTRHLHVYPDFHGNRSPIADPQMRGSIVGLELDSTLPSLCKLYHTTVESLCLQNLHILDTLNKAGHQVSFVFISGGQAKSLGFVQRLADIGGVGVVLPDSSGGGGVDAVVRGSAMLGRFAADATAARNDKEVSHKMDATTQAQDLWNIMVEMTPRGTLIPSRPSERERKLISAKYKIFRETADLQQRWREEMNAAISN